MTLFNEASIKVQGKDIFYLDTGGSGEKSAMLYIHGLACASTDCKHIADHFSDNYRVISISYLGTGKSDKPLDFSYTIEDQAKVVNGFVDAMKLNAVIVIAHSYGGGIAQSAIAQGPEKYQTLILLSSIGEIQHHIHNKMLVMSYVFHYFMKIPFINPILRRAGISFCKKNGISDKVFGDRTENHALLESIKRISFKDLALNVVDLKIPILYISCPDDKIVQKEVRDAMKKRINDFTTVELEGKSHFVFKTHIEEVNSHIESYLSNQNNVIE